MAAVALSLGSGSGGRRRRSCRAARRGDGGGAGAGAGCRHFHVHYQYHIPRQAVWASSPPAVAPVRYLLILPVIFLAALAFLVCFGWLTLVYLASSSLWSRSVDRAGDASGFAGEDEREERPVMPVTDTEHAAGRSGVSGVCAGEGKTEIGEAGDGISEERRYVSTMVSTGICFSDDERASDEKIVKEVMVFEPCKAKAFAELDGSSEEEEHQLLLMDIPIDCFLEEVINTRQFSISLSNATKLLDALSVGEVIAADTKEVSDLSSTEIWKFVDRHDTAAEKIPVHGAGADFVIPEATYSADSTLHGLEDEYESEIKQEQSLAELSADTVPGNVTDEWQETQTSVTEHNNKQAEPEAASSEGYRKQVVGVSDESHDSVRENVSENAAASNAPFHQTNSDEDTELQEGRFPNKRAEASTSASASAVYDFADNHWRTAEELAGSADEGNVHGEGRTSVLETAQDGDEDRDNHVSMVSAERHVLLAFFFLRTRCIVAELFPGSCFN